MTVSSVDSDQGRGFDIASKMEGGATHHESNTFDAKNALDNITLNAADTSLA